MDASPHSGESFFGNVWRTSEWACPQMAQVSGLPQPQDSLGKLKQCHSTTRAQQELWEGDCCPAHRELRLQTGAVEAGTVGVSWLTSHHQLVLLLGTRLICEILTPSSTEFRIEQNLLPSAFLAENRTMVLLTSSLPALKLLSYSEENSLSGKLPEIGFFSPPNFNETENSYAKLYLSRGVMCSIMSLNSAYSPL